MKRVFRFRLKTLLGLITFVSLCLGWQIHRANQQRAAIAKIRDLGGWVYYDFEIANGKAKPNARPWEPEWIRAGLGIDFFHSVVQVNMVYNDDGAQRIENRQKTPDALQYISRLPTIRTLLLSGNQATDENLHYVANLSHLRRLYMWGTQVSDEGIRQLRGLSNLRYLHCSNALLTDASLSTLAEMPGITGLSLQGNHFSDKGLAYLAKLPELETLWIGMGTTVISDEGLSAVENFKKLKNLDVQNSPLTVARLTRLFAGNPRIRIVHELIDNGPSRQFVSNAAEVEKRFQRD